MNKLEITIDKADELIAAMDRLAAALEALTLDEQARGSVVVIDPERNAEPTKQEEPHITSEQPKKEITDVQIRAVLTAKNKAGKKDAIQELLKRYGTVNLTKLDPAKYADFLKEAQEL